MQKGSNFKLISKFKSSWKNLIGDVESFSLEQRIFHGICLITATVLAISFPFNIIIGLNFFGYFVLGIFSLLLLLFRFSRFKNNYKISIRIYIVFLYITIFFSFFYNAGITGATIIVFILTFYILIAIAPQKQMWVWLIFHSIIGLTFLYLEYNYPQLIQETYKHIKFRYFDIALTYTLTLFAVYLATKYLRTNYLREEALAKRRQMVLNETNKVIIKQKIKLEEDNATKDKFFSIIAHDLINPFNGLIGLTDYLLTEYDSINDNKRKELIENINHSSTFILQLAQNLLTWARSQTHTIELHKEKHNLNKVVKDSIAPYLLNASNKNIKIELNVPEDIDLLLDRYTTSIVLGNLFSNAIKFTKSLGKITINAAMEDNLVKLKIKDTGVGIQESVLKNLFKVDKSSSTLGTNREEGTGLGLIVTKEFIELNKGKIFVESEVGKGSTFTVCFPV